MTRYWIELHCEGGTETEPASIYDADCRSFSCDNPGVMLSSLHRAPRALAYNAKGKGWTRSGTRWLCPSCTRKETK